MGPNRSLAVLLLLLLWRVWISAPASRASIQPPDLSMAKMTQMFQDFMLQFNKTYQTQEETRHRFKIFVQNLKSSRELQALELGTAQYGVTRFSDLTESEFVKMYGMVPPSLPPTLRRSDKTFQERTAPSCDWRKAGAITAVKYQGNCSSCWAFAAVSNIEALWNIHRRLPRNVSVQEMIDCTYNKKGCEGGFVWDGLQAVLNRSGLSNNRLYPYVGTDQRCQKHHGRTTTRIDGYEVLPRDEKYIADTVASQGPVTALLDMKGLQTYQKGIVHSSQACSVKSLNHVVTIVGFGKVRSRESSRSGPYWIIQNSWGDHWGEKGYFRLYRGTNVCGVAMYAATAIVETSKGKKPLVCPP